MRASIMRTKSALRRGVIAASVLWCGWALTCIGCRSLGLPVPASRPGVAAEQSVRPGVNEAYDNPNVDEWVGRFERESREIYRERRRIVKAIGLRPGMVVADIGAGTGLFTTLFAEAVAPGGKVLAVDLVPEFLELIRKRAREGGSWNVQTVRCRDRSVLLPPASIDVAFICDAYHHFEYPRSTMRSIHRALKPAGTLVVIDFDRVENQSREWILNHVRAGRDVVADEIESTGFALLEQADPPYLAENYMLRFRKVD